MSVDPRLRDVSPLDADGEPATRALQADLNRAAVKFRLGDIAEDGHFGPATRDRYEEVVWRLGIFPTAEIPLDQEQFALQILAGAEKRTAEQLGRERLRALNLGAKVEPRHVLLGVRMLKLIGDFDEWVHRRVETHCFGSEDATTVLRKTSIDFSLPAGAVTDLRRDIDDPASACMVPITFVNKWRLTRLDIRDESEKTLALLARDEHSPISVGMLVALAGEVCGVGMPPESTEFIPIEIENDLRAIVSEEPDTAVAVCERLGARAPGADTPEQDADRVLRWRKALVTSEPFMELAYELAQNFLVVVLCPPPLNARRILKVSYEATADRPARDSLRTRLASRYDALTRWISEDTWLRPGGRAPDAVGSLILDTTCETLTVGSRQAGDSPIPCAIVTIVTEKEREESFELETHGQTEIPMMPEGVYELHVNALDGFQLLSEGIVKVIVDRARPARETIRCRQLRALDTRRSISPIPVPSVGLGRRLLRGVAWRSKPVLIKLRLGEGGSYHYEFEAPQGLQVTRAKVADDRRGELDIVLHSAQRAHLYVPAALCRPATGYALLNLRPRAETVIRGATLTSSIASFAVLAVGIRWQVTGDAGSDGIAFLVGLPALLAAYFAYSIPNPITSTWLAGLRVVALAPGVMAFAAAALVLDGDKKDWALAALAALFVAMVIVTAVLWFALRFSTHPREQRSSWVAQSPGFVRRYLPRDGTSNI